MSKIIGNQENIEPSNFIGDFAYKSQIIGKGSFAKVYRGVNRANGETVALKFIKGENLGRANRLGLISNQVKTLQRLKGKENVLQWHSCVHHFDEICIVTQFCSKGTLKNVLKNEVLSTSQRIQFVYEINRGFQQIAKERIIHRDLKTSNIFLTNSGSIRIGDFGFAMFLDDINQINKSRVGSAHYMAPEVLVKFKYSTKSDIWSLGVIFYEILTGKKPWQGKNSKIIFQQIQRNPIQQLIESQSNIPPQIKDLIKKMLKFQVNDRIAPSQLDQVINNMHFKDEDISFIQENCNVDYQKATEKLEAVIDFCRMNYYTRCIMEQYVQKVPNCKLTAYLRKAKGRKITSYLSETIFSELKKIQQLSYLTKVEEEEFRDSSQHERIISIVNSYRQKYLSSHKSCKAQEKTLDDILSWFNQNITIDSPFMMLILFDFCLAMRSIKKKLQNNSIENLIKKYSIAEMSEQLKQEALKSTKNYEKCIRVKQLYLVKRNYHKASARK